MSFLPPDDVEHLSSKGISFEEHEEDGHKAVVLKDFSLPQGKFNRASADVLILLPTGYPDAAPDMFYVLPWLRLASNGAYARAADVPHTFGGQTWQRWSRHSDTWTPGEDGIWTMLKRAEVAFQVAA